MAEELDIYRIGKEGDDKSHPLAREAREALSQSEPEVVGELTDQELLRCAKIATPCYDLEAWERELRMMRAAITADRARHCQPAPLAAGEVGQLVAWLRERATWCAVDDPSHEKYDRAADLLEQRHPAPVPVSERLPGADEMDGSLVWAGCQAPGLPYWEWCLDDVRHPCSSGYTHWLPVNTPVLPTALPIPSAKTKHD